MKRSMEHILPATPDTLVEALQDALIQHHGSINLDEVHGDELTLYLDGDPRHLYARLRSEMVF